MFTDPLSVTINAITTPLPRVGNGPNDATYSSNDGTIKETYSHQYGSRTRRLARIDFSKIAPNPLISSENIKYGMGCYLVVDVPQTGFTVVEQKQVIDGFIAQLNASSGALITKLLGGES